LNQLRNKGIDTKFIVEAKKDKYLDSWKAFEESCRRLDPPYTVVWIDQPEHADYWCARWEFESVQAECRVEFDDLWPEYEAWQWKWEKHFYKRYKIGPASGCGLPLNKLDAAQYESDRHQKLAEEKDLMAP